jgi:2-hydroxychromene-2-carboxylate isomerase
MADGKPVFYYDLGSPYSYLAAERVNSVLPVVPVWQPILLGGGKRVFPDDGHARTLELVSTTTTGTGVLICTYRPAGR